MNANLPTVVLPLAIGVIAGLRAMTAPAAVSWAAYLGVLPVSSTAFAFMGYRFAPWILSVLALGEFVTDQLPTTPSRKVPVQFGARILMGGLSGGIIGAGYDAFVIGLVAGMIGAVIGTLGGSAARARLAAAFGQDRPAALIEDAVAIGGAALIVMALP